MVVPVNYVREGESVLIRLAPESALARSLDSTPASFQVDEFDDFTQSGWSVLLRGTASYVDPDDHPATSPRPGTCGPGPRGSGPGTCASWRPGSPDAGCLEA